MKKIAFVSAFLLLLVGSAMAQTDTDTIKKQAKLQFRNTIHDFGTIYQGDIVNYTFQFRNDGNAPLILNKVRAYCGCTATAWSNEPVQPGEWSNITIKFNSAGKMGKQAKGITVFSNAKVPRRVITIKAKILPPDRRRK